MAYDRPRPAITSLNQPYWDALRNHELRMPRCSACGRVWFPPAPRCPRCWSSTFDWALLSGRGQVSSWVVFHQSYFPSFEADLPYNVAEVELDEGPRLLSNVVGEGGHHLAVGLPVDAVFDDVAEDLTLLRFRPAPAG